MKIEKGKYPPPGPEIPSIPVEPVYPEPEPIPKDGYYYPSDRGW